MNIKTLIADLEYALDRAKITKSDLRQILELGLLFVEEVGRLIEKGSIREREEVLYDLITLQQKLEKHLQYCSLESGKTVEQCAAYNEDSRFFSEEEWCIWQKTLRQLADFKTKTKQLILKKRPARPIS